MTDYDKGDVVEYEYRVAGGTATGSGEVVGFSDSGKVYVDSGVVQMVEPDDVIRVTKEGFKA